MDNYVVYHLHSYYSLLDSCTSPKEYVDKAVELGQTALCFTEHGNIFQWFEKKKLCEDAGLKYIHGIECYVTETLKEKIRDNWHTILIAKNYDGFVEINNLFYKSYQPDHTYYKHRISIDEFLNISDNVIKISACIQSPLFQMRKKLADGGIEAENKYINLLKHYDYYEIQYHNFEDQINYNKYLFEMSKQYNKPLIVGTDTHCIDTYKAECRIILQYGKTDGAWGDSENECDMTYKSYDELIKMFEVQNSLPMDVIREAINNTNIMAKSVEELIIDTHDKYPYLYGEKDEEVMWRVLHNNYQQKLKDGIISDSKEYLENIEYEMSVFKKTNMVGFMLFMSELMTWAKDNGIATGSARGSVAGSTVAYISNITDVDPIKWKTIFSRFCNEHRVEIGDIDTDWYEDDRQKIYDYIINRFGTQKTGYVLALGTLAEKSVIDVIGKAYRIMAEKDGSETPYTIAKIKEIKAEFDKDSDKARTDYPDIFYYYDGLVGCVVSQSQHPAGIIASPINLIDFCGAFLGEDGQQILPLDMDCCHDTGLVKYDILGLKTVGVIDKTCKLLGRKYPKVHEINFDDQAVFDDMTRDHSTIFQFESSFAGDCLKRMGCKSVFDMSLVNASIRPSGESYRDKLLARECNKNPSEIIDKLLERNYGHLVYQEDTIAFLQNICGFSGSDADNVRRAIGRKKVDELNKALPKILDGYCSKSDKPREIAEQEAMQFLKIIEDASSYQFGYNHSIAYSIMSYLCGYFRYYYPVEYCTSYLNCAKNDDDITNGTALMKNYGITMSSARFRHSLSEYKCDSQNKIIYKGLSSIKNMNKKVAEEMYALRDNNYIDFIEVLDDLESKTSLDSRQLDILIKINFFEEFGDINKLLYLSQLYKKIANSKVISKKKIPDLGIDEDTIAKFAIKESPSQYKFDYKHIRAMLGWVASLCCIPKSTVQEQIKYQLELLGYIDYTNADLDSRYAMVTDVDTRYSPKIKLYGLKKGQTCEVKAYKKKPWKNKEVVTTFATVPLEKGDVIYMTKCKKEFKKVKNSDGDWVNGTDMEWWLYDYRKVEDL